MSYQRCLRYILAPAIVITAVYFFYLQFKRNADALSTFRFSVNFYYILISVVWGSLALLAGPFVWRMYVNDHLRRKLGFLEGFVLYCTSTMFKYIPGKVWTYAAQIALMSSKEISNALLIYINLACFICLAFVSTAYALYYYLFYLAKAAWETSVLIFVLLIVLDYVFVVWNNEIVNRLMIPVKRIFKIEITPIKTRKAILIYVQIVYFFAFSFLGIGMYFLAKGLNMEIPFANIPAIMATVSISAIAGYLAFFSMGGLGVREGAMFFMLKQFSNIGIALILPIAARLLMVVVELLMAIVAIMTGMRCGYFSGLTEKAQNKETAIDANLQGAE